MLWIYAHANNKGYASEKLPTRRGKAFFINNFLKKNLYCYKNLKYFIGDLWYTNTSQVFVQSVFAKK